MISEFNYVKPKSISEALDYLESKQNSKVLAGGTDLMIALRHNAFDCGQIVDIKGISELNKLQYTPGKGLYIGSAVKVNELESYDIISEKYPAIAQAAKSLASYQLRNRATVVGNLCNASPGADLPGPLLVYNAQVHIISPEGEKTVDLQDFFTGVKKTVLQENEIVTGITVPDVDENDKSVYLRQTRIHGHDLAIVGVSVRKNEQDEISVAMAAVAPTPVRLKDFEKEIAKKGITKDLPEWAESQVANYIKPISDVRSSAEYRSHMSKVLLKQGLSEILEMEVQ